MRHFLSHTKAERGLAAHAKSGLTAHAKSWRGLAAERLSQRVFYIILAVAALVFVLFFLVGFDRPYDLDYGFNDPLLTDAVMILMYVSVLLAVLLAAYSGYRAWKLRVRGDGTSNNIPVSRIRKAVAAGTLACALLTLLAGSTAPMRINGSWYTDALWLRVSDMFLWTSIVLLAVAVGAVAYGATRYIRRKESAR